MSLVVIAKVSDGIVLAADSRTTLLTRKRKLVIASSFDNIPKIFSVDGQSHIGLVVCGQGAIGTTDLIPINILARVFSTRLVAEKVGKLSVQEFSKKLSGFLIEQWSSLMPPNSAIQPIQIFVAGYDDEDDYGQAYEFDIPDKPEPTNLIASRFGIAWAGQSDVIEMLVKGYDKALLKAVQSYLSLADDQMESLRNHFDQNLSSDIPFYLLSLQDCVDMAVYLIKTTILFQYWQTTIRSVGGPINVAVITRESGFKWLSKTAITIET